MKTILFLFLLISNVVFAQNELKHEVYFDTSEYKIPTIEENRLLLFIKKKETKKKLSDNLKVGDKIVLKNILFEIGYRTVLEESKEALDNLAEILIEKENIYFSIQGHVCCTQNSRDAVDVETKKQNLSLVRAKYIYDYLSKKGVTKKRMKYVRMRRKFPLGGDPKFDRRVEIVITYISDKKK